MTQNKDLEERIAKAIYHASFMPTTTAELNRAIPSPGWCWDRASEVQKGFCRRQAQAAIEEMQKK